MVDFNAQIIDEFRSNKGTVTTWDFGRAVVLIHHTGARSGAERTNPLFSLPTDDGWLIAASAGGAPKHPDWFYNLVANPEITIEYADDADGIATAEVVAEVLEGAARDEAWARFTAASPGFADYEEKAGDRVIPVVALHRV